MNVFRLENTIQRYAWGSRSAIPDLLGIENPDGAPMAELWMGTHPKAPSRIVVPGGTKSLLEALRETPRELLGDSVTEAFGGDLPFLFKVLAAGSSLSIQAHPSISQARSGFDREEREGIGIDDPHRNYRDRNHKPEILCPLTVFDALCGFRTREAIVSGLSVASTPLTDRALARLSEGDEAEGLRSFFVTLLGASEEETRATVAAFVAAARRSDDEVSRRVVELDRNYPGDIGVLAPWYLNLVRLQPGEALYLEAGVLHAYLGGTGIELMANSDNVLRGGLTVKHVDVAELERTLVFKSRRVDRLMGEIVAPGLSVFRTPTREFELSVIRPDSSDAASVEVDRTTPAILLCVDGEAAIGSMALRRGESCFVTPAAQPLRVSGGSAVIFRASVPDTTGLSETPVVSVTPEDS